MNVLIKLSIIFIFLIQFFLTQTTTPGVETPKYNIATDTWFNFEPGENFRVEGSRFIISSSLAEKYYPYVASFLAREDLSENSFGVRASWDRFSINYLDIIPENIPEFKGIPTRFNIWLWGNNTNIEVVAIFTRPDGLSYTASMGKLNFKGWEQRTVDLPSHVFKSENIRDPSRNYSFDRFRVYLNNDEPVNDLFFFFDRFTMSENIQHQRYDGYELEQIIAEEIKTSREDSDNVSANENTNSEDDNSPTTNDEGQEDSSSNEADAQNSNN